MAEAVVSFLLERIGDFLISEANIILGVSGEVEQLGEELRRMQAFLKDAYNNTYESEAMDNLVAEIREIVYDAEDILDSFTAKVEARRRKNIMEKITGIPKKVSARHEVRLGIQDIKAKIINLNRSLKGYAKSALGDAERSKLREDKLNKLNKLRRVYPHVYEDVDDFVGFHQDVDMLVENLVDENKHCRVVSIYGMGGVGKTTVAKRVYHHPKVRSYFDCFAWVYMSRHWEKKDIPQIILLELKQFNLNLYLKSYEEELYNFQKRFKCLIVLDDIWDRNDWDLLKSAFPDSSMSKMLITTRKEDVARHLDRNAFLHKLRCLNEDESWELLKKKAFAGRQLEDYSADPEMEKNGKKMIGGCGGLPLAIKVLGGVLVDKNSQGWASVLKRMYLILERGQDIQQEDGTVQQVLDLSYDDLPSQMKRCFLYMGNLGDYSIEGEKLCLLWIAENLISKEDVGDGETMMDAAQLYLNELEQRSMVEKETSDDREVPSYWDLRRNHIFSVRKYEARTNRRVESFRLHDLVRNLCLKKKECFFKTIDFRSQENVSSQDSSSSTSSTKTRRMAIILDKDGNGYVSSRQHGESKHLRSLLFRNVDRFSLPNLPPEISDFKKFKLLRVLDIEGFEGNISEEIVTLILMRYLAFKRNEVSVLPSSICKLQYLQTLDLSGCSVISIPNVLWKMKKLWHLYVPSYTNITGEKLRLDGLNELETLEYFNPDYFDVEDLMKLSNLRRLAANIALKGGHINLDSIVNFLNNGSHNIQKLCLTAFLNNEYLGFEGVRSLQQVFGCRILQKLSLRGNGTIFFKLPEYNIDSYSSSLTHISLNGTNLDDDPMATLEKLPYLEFLLMTGRAYIRTEMVCSAVGFPKLKILLLEGFSELQKWEVYEGAMPNLSCLEITNCQELEMLPDRLRFLTALRELTIAMMPEAFVNRVQVKEDVAAAGEDVYKIQHVPFITFGPSQFSSLRRYLRRWQ